MKVISGGQTGADQAGLYAAKFMDYETGGSMPMNYKTEDGPRPDLADMFGLEELPLGTYSQRTIANIIDADLTLIFGRVSSRGSQITVNHCKFRGKDYFVIPNKGIYRIKDEIAKHIFTQRVEVINVAGNRESVWPGIFKWVQEELIDIFLRVKLLEDTLEEILNEC